MICCTFIVEASRPVPYNIFHTVVNRYRLRPFDICVCMFIDDWTYRHHRHMTGRAANRRYLCALRHPAVSAHVCTEQHIYIYIFTWYFIVCASMGWSTWIYRRLLRVTRCILSWSYNTDWWCCELLCCFRKLSYDHTLPGIHSACGEFVFFVD